MATPFEHLAFERALGRAAIGALMTALNDLNHFDNEAICRKTSSSSARRRPTLRR